MAPKRNPTQATTLHSTDTDTSTGQANNQVVTRRDMDMLAQNLTTSYTEQLRAIVSVNAATPHQQALLMLMYTTNQALLCKFFPTTLSGVALNWHTSLPAGSIHTFAHLEAMWLPNDKRNPTSTC